MASEVRRDGILYRLWDYDLLFGVCLEYLS